MASDNGIQSEILKISQYIEELQRQSLDIPDKVTKALAAALEEFEVNLEVYGPDGSPRQVDTASVGDASGSIIKSVSVACDVTEQRQAEEALKNSEKRYHLLFENMLDGFAHCKMLYDDHGHPTDFIYLDVNSAFERLTGLKNVVGKRVTEVVPGIKELHPELFDTYSRVALTGKPERFEIELTHLGIWLLISVYSMEKGYFVAVFDNITERKRAGEALRIRALQQEVVARLGLQAMAGSDPAALMDEAVMELAKTLGVEYTKVLELMPNGKELLLVSGVGWQEGLVGLATVGSGLDSQAGYTLLSSEPVVVENLKTEKRFNGPPLLHEHGVTSGMSVVISSHGRPFGVLGAHTINQRTFTADDVHFLQAIANLIAMVVEQKRVESELEDNREHLEELVQDRTHELKATNAELHAEITERKRAEAALRESEQRFRDAIDNFPNVFVIYGPDRRIQFINSIGLEITGHREVDVIGLRDEEIFPPEIINSYLPALKRAVETKMPQTLERTRIASMGGQTVVINIIPLLDECGEIRRILGITYDITERKRSEKALAKEQANLQTIFDVVNVGMLLIDENGIVKRINNTISQTVGIKDPSTLCGHQPGDLLGCIHVVNDPAGCGHTPHCSTCRIRDAFETVLRTGQPIHGVETEATLLINGNETRLWLEASVDPLVLDGKPHVILAINEITERKLAEEAHSLLASIVDSAEEAIIGKTLEGIIVSWNAGAEKIYGYSADEVIDRPVSILIPPDHVDEMPQTLERISLGERVDRYETMRLRKDGRQIYVSLIVSPIINEQGKVVGASTIAADITERKRAEEEIKKLNQDLQHRAAALEAANKELESFSYSVSHDLRSPLRAMDGFSRILQEDYSAQIPPEAQRYLQLVRSSTQQMGRLIDDLLAFSRLGRQPLNKQCVLPIDLVNNVLDELKNERAGRQIEIVIGDLPACEADPTLLKQVFVNLISNALKFTRKREAARIEIGSQIMNGKAVYFIKDNGAGFDMQYVHKLFGVFQRLHSADEYEGNGVGLANIQRIIHRHGGNIWAEGEVDRGATFYFTLNGGI